MLVNEVITSGAQTQVMKSDQGIFSFDNRVEGSTTVLVGASAANAVIEKIVLEIQSNTRAIVAYAGWASSTAADFGSSFFGLDQVIQMRGQRVSAESKRAAAKRQFRLTSW